MSRYRDYATGLTCGVEVPAGGKRFLSFPKYVIGFGVHPASYSIGAGLLSRGLRDRSVKLTTNLHVGPRLRMSGVVLPLPLYAFMTLKWRTFYLVRSVLVLRCLRLVFVEIYSFIFRVVRKEVKPEQKASVVFRHPRTIRRLRSVRDSALCNRSLSN
jgi:hypothetical protein